MKKDLQNTYKYMVYKFMKMLSFTSTKLSKKLGERNNWSRGKSDLRGTLERLTDGKQNQRCLFRRCNLQIGCKDKPQNTIEGHQFWKTSRAGKKT